MNPGNRNRLNLYVDTLGYLAFVVLLASGYVMKYVLLPGSRMAAGDPTSLMGYSRHDWGDIHFWAAVVFLTCIIVHLYLHWSWLLNACKNHYRIRTAVGVGLALLIPLLIVFIPLLSARGFEEEGGQGQRRGRGGQSSLTEESEPSEGQSGAGFHIRGRTTLQEIEQETGVSVQEILSALGLPADTPTDERLSVLREQYDIELSELRAVVEDLAAGGTGE